MPFEARPSEEQSVEEIDLLSRSNKKVKVVQETSSTLLPEEEMPQALEAPGMVEKSKPIKNNSGATPSYKDIVMNVGDSSFSPEEIIQLET